MTRRSHCHDMSDLNVAGVVSVFAEQRRLTAETGRPICGEFLGFGRRGRVHACSLEPRHPGPHVWQQARSPSDLSATASIGPKP
jgi:hypothetical protein